MPTLFPRLNAVPLALTLLGGALVMAIQHWLRPLVPADAPVRWLLNLSPNLFTALCAPFAVLIPSFWRRRPAAVLFLAAAALIVGVLLRFELEPVLAGRRPLDLPDVMATLGGATLAILYFRLRLHSRLHYRS